MTDLALHRLGGEGPDMLFIQGSGADRLGWLAVTPQLFGEAPDDVIAAIRRGLGTTE